MLRTLTSSEVHAFFVESVLSRATRRKLAVHVRAALKEEPEEGPAQASAHAQPHGAEAAHVISDVYAFKRGAELFASLR